MDQIIVPSRKQLRYFEIARQESIKSACKYRHGTIIIADKTAIFKGYNIEKHPTHRFGPIVNATCWTLHSEIAALLKLTSWTIWMSARVYNFRLDRNGEIADSRPCDTCQYVLAQTGRIKYVYYTTRTYPNYHKLFLKMERLSNV